MRTVLRWTASAVLFLGTAFWFFGGPNLGWTKTSVPIIRQDPVTELEYTEWQKNFVPGVDFLALCAFGSALIAGCSWLAPTGRRRQSPDSPPRPCAAPAPSSEVRQNSFPQ